MAGQRGLALIDVLIVMVVLGVGLGGLARFLAATLDMEGQARRHMSARLMALSALEQGGAVPAEGPLRVAYGSRGGRREARVVWFEGVQGREVRLQAGYGRD